MYEQNALGYRSCFALCLTKVRSSYAGCPATALIIYTASQRVTGYRYIAHLYCLAVQACFYSDVVECSLSTRENLV